MCMVYNNYTSVYVCHIVQWHKKMIWSRGAGNVIRINTYIAVAGYAHHKSKGDWGHSPPGKFRFSQLLI